MQDKRYQRWEQTDFLLWLPVIRNGSLPLSRTKHDNREKTFWLYIAFSHMKIPCLLSEKPTALASNQGGTTGSLS